ncbi:Glycine/D-amino acid oxidase [Cognatiyoonia koreensis]|uniref:Glycine/D-amino acid oxidase n=1 Tax=Cognatiyoonia koreensis TaxID=364200 RepID=A0A1I0QK44_9RHOB|nr:FAD-dependent oxidoreductase [Cognatiyoonia koreensis]SEW27353.1 Glycine/D-amino acid oxidase [Cognatiyoonia koreensis]
MIDFLVIGGGIAGVSAAARLSAMGSVTVLEQETALGYHASGRSAALYERNYGKPSTIALNTASLQFHEDADVLSPRGFLLVGKDGEDDAFDADRDYMQIPEIGVDEAVDLFPILDRKVITRAAHDPAAWDIDTDLLIQTFAKIARQNGGTITTRAQVSDIKKTDQGWAVTAADVVEARVIINAAGAWVDKIAELAGIAPLGFQPFRRSMGRIPAPGGLDVSSWPMIFGPGETWYAKPDAGALLVSPADQDPVEPHDAFPDDMVLAEGFARYEAHVTEPVTRLLASWAGLRTFAPDRQLVLGPASDDNSFIWCAGQGGYGMQSSPGASQVLADIIGGKATVVDDETLANLSPARFR